MKKLFQFSQYYLDTFKIIYTEIFFLSKFFQKFKYKNKKGYSYELKSDESVLFSKLSSFFLKQDMVSSLLALKKSEIKDFLNNLKYISLEHKETMFELELP